MLLLAGTVSKIVYQKNDFVVGFLKNSEKTIKFCGTLPGVKEGTQVILWGNYKDHSKYGHQFVVKNHKTNTNHAFPYLSSGLVRHVGESTAKQITETFPDPIKTITTNPLELTAIKGITPEKANEIAESVRQTIKYKDTATLLAPCKLSPATLVKVHEHFSSVKKLADILKNPYILSEVKLIGWKKADQTAKHLGIKPDSPQRIKAACLYVLHEAAQEGHTYLTNQDLAIRTYKLLGETIHPTQIEKVIFNLDLPREKDRLYLPNLYQAEITAASFFQQYKPPDPIDPTSHLAELNLPSLSAAQEKAVKAVFKYGAIILTGGPGTGKTTTVSAITALYKKLYPGRPVILAAPTGRASRRIAEVTGLEARTMHLLITAKKPIGPGLLVIDEMSMVDIELLGKFLPLIREGTHIVMVGDPDQLPSVGPGAVLQDLIKILPTIELSQVFRQAQESDIILNAHNIKNGDLNLHTGKDFFYIQKEEPQDIVNAIILYAKKWLNQNRSLDGLQVIAPMKKGTIGTENINRLLQDLANPDAKGKLRAGDRVVQLTNNYSKNVFNGDLGKITCLRPFTVAFQNDTYPTKEVQYEPHELDQVALAYAITIHKSQGSEFPVTVIPIHTQHYIMLNRRVLYTAVTRAKRQVVLVGSNKALAIALADQKIIQRNSTLADRLREPGGKAHGFTRGMKSPANF